MKHLRLLLASTLTLIVVVVSACSIGGNTVNKKLWWDGSLPFEQRQSIEEFEDHIENTLGEFAYTYSANTGPISVYVPSNLEACGEEGFELFTAAIAFAPPFDHNDMINAVAHTFTPLGYELLTQDEDHIRWMDKANGGYITLLFLDDGNAGLRVASGCRPTDGTTKVGQTRNIPDWEYNLTPNTPQS